MEGHTNKIAFLERFCKKCLSSMKAVLRNSMYRTQKKKKADGL